MSGDFLHAVPIDRIEAYEPWAYLRAIKTVMSEECTLLPASGALAMPESAILAAIFGVGRLLLLSSSEFEKDGTLTGIHDFSFGSLPQPGEIVQVKVSVIRHVWTDVVFKADVSSRNHFVARGDFTLEETQLPEADASETLRLLWIELQSHA